MSELATNDKAKWIFKSGWKGLCPRCGKGPMFNSWLKISDTCEVCQVDYGFASPDDGPAFFSLCFVAFPLMLLVVWIHAVFETLVLVLLLVALPLLSIACVLSLRPIKGWLVASQFVNCSVGAGTEKLWAQMREREEAAKRESEGK